MRQTLLNRAVAGLERAARDVAPIYMARRAHARAQLATVDALAGGDGSGRGGSFGRWASRLLGGSRDAQSEIMPTLSIDRAESRQLARFSPIAVGAINTNVDRVVGTGLALVAAPHQEILGWSDERALKWKSKVQAEFSMHADDPAACDYYAQQTFYEAQGLVLRSTLESGDCATLLPDVATDAMRPYALRFQILEADRVGNPGSEMDSATLSGGIKTDASGRPIAAHVYNRHPGAAFLAGVTEPFGGQWYDFTGRSGRRRLLMHLRKLRPGQLRGLPYLAPIVDCLKQIARYSEAEITAAVVSAMFTVFIKTPTGNAAPVFAGEAPQQAEATGEIGLGNGAIVGLAPGEEPIFADPNRPNPNFEAFVAGVMVQVGMALNLPANFLMKKHDASYTAARAAFLDAWVYFRGVRHWLAGSFCQPYYETWLAEAVAKGRIEAPGFFKDPLLRWAYTRAEWRGDSMGSINPKDEVAAYTSAIDARLTTRERAEWELFGTDFDATLQRKASEEKRLKAAEILPVPKAGAAAAPAPGKAPAKDPATV